MVKIGYWLSKENGVDKPVPFSGHDTWHAHCSVCGGDALENSVEEPIWSLYCPHCGAEMKNGRSEEEQERLKEAYWEELDRKEKEKQKARRAKMTEEEREAEDLYYAQYSTGMCNPAEYQIKEAQIADLTAKGYDFSFLGCGRKRR